MTKRKVRKNEHCGNPYLAEDLPHRFPCLPGLPLRVIPGSVVPAGECTRKHCIGLCYLVTYKDVDVYELSGEMMEDLRDEKGSLNCRGNLYPWAMKARAFLIFLKGSMEVSPCL